MPDAQGKLSQEEKDRAIKWLGERAKPPPCPFCGSGNWTLAEHTVNVPIYTPNTMMLGGPSYPCVMLVSEPCGHSVLFNAVVMGVIANPPPEKKKEE